ncbi:hypothetical protein TNCV_4410871 [Trichonephila clavipes]|nr:hypothetical protein TNCV_4410871 [Trichonephila clavipes]
MQSEHHDSLREDPQGSNNATECCICLKNDDSERYALIECKYTFHSICLKQWVECGKNTCPYCRGKLLKKDKINIGCGAFSLQVLRDLYGSEIDAIDLEDLMSDTESDSGTDSDTESDSDSDSFSESMLEFIPGTMDQLIQDLLESIPKC